MFLSNEMFFKTPFYSTVQDLVLFKCQLLRRSKCTAFFIKYMKRLIMFRRGSSNYFTARGSLIIKSHVRKSALRQKLIDIFIWHMTFTSHYLYSENKEKSNAFA